MESATSILQLPGDCLHVIFGKLSCTSDRDSFGLTCRHWLHIQNLSRRSLCFDCSFTHLHAASISRPPINIDALRLNRLLTRFSQLQSLNLSGCTQLPDSGLSTFLDCGLNLQSLCLDCCFGITDSGLSYVARGCPSLKIISLYMCNISDLGLKTLSRYCLSLQDVNLSYCLHITVDGIRHLSKICHQLRVVNISHCKTIDGVCFRGCSETMVYLEASACKLEVVGVLSIVSGGGLEYLNISNIQWSIHGHGIASIDVELISKLRVIDFRMCRTIGDDAIVKIAQGCPFRESNLAVCHDIRILGWSSIGSNFHNLEILHVNRCQNLCDLGLQASRDGCTQLSKLHIALRSMSPTQ